MIDHEKAVIGMILNDPDLFDIASSIIDTIDFSEKTPGIIWSEIKHISQSGIKPNRHYVSNAFTDRFGAENNEYIMYMNDSCKYFDGDITHHAKIVKKQSKDRVFIYSLTLAQNSETPVDYILDALDVYQNGINDNSRTFKDLIGTVVDRIESAQDGMTGLSTGIPAIDRITGGLQGGKLYTISARPGAGKTALTNQIALNVAGRQVPVGICSLEMSEDELGFRAIARVCNAPMDGLYSGDDEALGRMSAGMSALNIADWPLHFNTEDDELTNLISQIRIWKIKKSIQLVVVDHVGLVSVYGKESKRLEINEVTRQLKKLAKTLDIPVIMTAQINRKIDGQNREPYLSDLKESGSIEEDSDAVMFIHEVLNQEGKTDHFKFILAKNRSGKKGYVGAGFSFKGETQTFTELTRESFERSYDQRGI